LPSPNALAMARSKPWLRHRVLWPAIGLAGATALALLLFARPRGPEVSSQAHITPIALPFELIGYPGFSKDGQWIAAPGRAPSGRAGLYYLNAHGGDQRLIYEGPEFARINYADISPDGGQIVFSGAGGNGRRRIAVVPSLGGDDRMIGEGIMAQWRPDGDRI